MTPPEARPPGHHGFIGKQTVLPWNQALSIALESLRVRIGRSLITASAIGLACAFLSYTLASDGLLGSLRELDDADVNFLLQKRGIDLEAGPAGLEARALWLIATSMVVCLVGVSSALLMAVTERIREIGTMKCLGAMNGLVVKLFLLEALFLGALSSFSGALLGIVLCAAFKVLEYGPVAFAAVPWPAWLVNVAAISVLGTGLAVVAAIYPSLIAARMQPVDAMRTEV